MAALSAQGADRVVAYDMEMAEEICKGLPLEAVEGVWLYPEDKVSVLILSDNSEDKNSLPVYTISVVDTSDVNLHPGEEIGKLKATVEENVFEIELATERKGLKLLKPKSVLATLSKDGDKFIIKKEKSPFRGRLNLNFSRLLPGFWKILSIGVSQNNRGGNPEAAVGMVKIYPSYDGNGSSKGKVRYL